MTVWYKQGVLGDLQIPTRKALGHVSKLLESVGEDLFITALRDGNHSAGSLHYDGYAFDMSPSARITVQKIKEALGMDFDVVNEGNHFHVEYDPK